MGYRLPIALPQEHQYVNRVQFQPSYHIKRLEKPEAISFNAEMNQAKENRRQRPEQKATKAELFDQLMGKGNVINLKI